MTTSEQASIEADGPRIFAIIRGGKGSTAESDESQDPRTRPETGDDSVADPTDAPRSGEESSVSEAGESADPLGDRSASDDDAETGDAQPREAGGREADEVDAADEAEAAEAIAAQATALLEDADPVVYHRALSGLVREGHSAVLAPLDYTADLPFHDPSRVWIDPAPTTVDTALLYARAAYPDFDEVLLAGFGDPARSDLLVGLYDLLFVEGRNVALITNHGQIIDIALVMASLFAAMLDEDRTFGVLGARLSIEDMAEHSNTLVSRMVATRQAFGIPAVQVLQSISRIFLSVPQTASRRRAKLDPTLVKANNTLMRFELEKRLAGGGQLVAMAASGTQDLTIPQLMSRARTAWRHRRGDDPGEEPTLHLQPLYNGTISLMRACDYVLPVAISLDAKCPAMVVGSITKLHEDEDCHRIMDWIALAHQDATGVPTIYHRPGDDLLTQVRALINR